MPIGVKITITKIYVRQDTNFPAMLVHMILHTRKIAPKNNQKPTSAKLKDTSYNARVDTSTMVHIAQAIMELSCIPQLVKDNLQLLTLHLLDVKQPN